MIRVPDENNAPLVAITIVNWNGWKDTLKCIESLRQLKYPRYEIFVVDNGSTDNSVEKIRSYWPEVRILETKRNLGYGGGCNVGIREALKGVAKYVWLLNNDIYVHSDDLLKLVEVGEKLPRSGAIGSVVYFWDSPAKVHAWGGGRVNHWLGTTRLGRGQEEKELDYLNGASLLLRREAIEDVGLFDERFFMYWEDTDMGTRLRSHGWELSVAPESRVLHKVSGSLNKERWLLNYYYGYSHALYCRKHVKYYFVPIIVGLMLRASKRVANFEFKALRGLFSGTLAGIRAST